MFCLVLFPQFINLEYFINYFRDFLFNVDIALIVYGSSVIAMVSLAAISKSILKVATLIALVWVVTSIVHRSIHVSTFLCFSIAVDLFLAYKFWRQS